MRFFDLLIMSINNLRRRKLRTGLTVLGNYNNVRVPYSIV